MEFLPGSCYNDASGGDDSNSFHEAQESMLKQPTKLIKVFVQNRDMIVLLLEASVKHHVRTCSSLSSLGPSFRDFSTLEAGTDFVVRNLEVGSPHCSGNSESFTESFGLSFGAFSWSVTRSNKLQGSNLHASN